VGGGGGGVGGVEGLWWDGEGWVCLRGFWVYAFFFLLEGGGFWGGFFFCFFFVRGLVFGFGFFLGVGGGGVGVWFFWGGSPGNLLFRSFCGLRVPHRLEQEFHPERGQIFSASTKEDNLPL